MKPESLVRRFGAIGVLVDLVTRPRYPKKTLAILEPFMNGGGTIDDSWETNLEIYLSHEGRKDLVDAAIRLLPAPKRIKFISTLATIPGIVSFQPKHDQPGEDNIIQEIWHGSHDQDALQTALTALKLPKDQSGLITRALHPL